MKVKPFLLNAKPVSRLKLAIADKVINRVFLIWSIFLVVVIIAAKILSK